MKRKIVINVLVFIWIGLWIYFSARPYFVKTHGYKYQELLTAKDKKSFVYGADYLAFLNFCKEHTPEYSTYQEYGVQYFSLEMRRLEYQLYPRIRSENPDFLLVYKTNTYPANGYEEFQRLNADTLILRKRP